MLESPEMDNGDRTESNPPKLVICYTREDRAVVEEITEYFTSLGAVVWFDKHIGPGKPWGQEVIDCIVDSDAFVAVLSAAAMNSTELLVEVQSAIDNKRPVFPIRINTFPINRRLGSQLKPFNILDGFDIHGRRSFCEAVMAEISPGTPVPLKSARGRGVSHLDNPYRGPLPFTEKQADLFCGRDKDIQDAVNLVDRDQQRLIMIHGPSGTGKTSFLQAKLIPALNACGYYTPPPVRIAWPSLDEAVEKVPRDVYVREQITANGEPRVSALADVQEFLRAGNGEPTQTSKGTVLIFDQFEELFNYEYSNGLKTKCFLDIRDALKHFSPLRIILVFREEYFGQINRLYKGNTEGVGRATAPQIAGIVLSPMNQASAVEAICTPARKKGVDFDRGLAEAIAFELRKVKVLQDGIPTQKDIKEEIEPVHLQIVCRYIWNLVPEKRTIIDGHVLASAAATQQSPGASTDIASIDSLLFFLISDVLERFYDDVVSKIQDVARRDGVNYPEKLVRMGCLQFVTPNGHRVLIRKDELGRVGRLPFWVVRVLEDEHFLRADRRGTATWYELAHDKLVDPVQKVGKKDAQQLLLALEALGAAMKRLHRGENSFCGVFEEHDSILRGLNAFQEHEGLFSNEAEFVFRSALRTRTRSGQLTEDQKSWARLLAGTDAETFAAVLLEALSPAVCAEDSVRQNAIELLRQPEFRNRLSSSKLDELRLLIREAALKESEEVQPAACKAVCELGRKPGGEELFELLADGNQKQQARRAIAWVRHAADRREFFGAEAGKEFEDRWQTLRFKDRIRILGQLWVQRAIQSFGWMAFVIVMATVFTAIGAGVAYAPMGFLGAALTLADKGGGAAKGGFHGIAGGTFWAIGVSTALLGYWVIVRGGRVAPKYRDWIPAALSACMGGFLAGVTLSFVLGFVFQNESLYHAGWLCTNSPSSTFGVKLNDMFLETRHGWVTPIFGFGIGVGICWSLRKITADPRTEQYVQRQSGAIQRPGEAFDSIGRIAKLVTKGWWRNAIAVALAGVAIFYILRPGPGICDPAASGEQRASCAAYRGKFAMPACGEGQNPPPPPLAPKLARVAGMVFIITTGSIFLEVGLLFGILAARAGVRLERDEHFLETLPDARRVVGEQPLQGART